MPDSRLSRLRPTRLAPTRLAQSQLAQSPWLRAGLLTVAVGLAVYGLASQWTQVHAALAKLDGYDVAGAALCVIAGLGWTPLAWRALLADLGSSLPLPTAIRLDLVLRVLRKAPLEESVSSAGMARALAWTTLGWLCYGAHAWFLISVFAGKSPHVFALSLGGYALAWSVGFLIIFFPGGIGPREIALIAVLAPVMSSASALVVALASRVVMTIGDLFWAGIGLAFGRARPMTAVRDSAVRDPAVRDSAVRDSAVRDPAPLGSVSALTEPAGNQPSTARDRRL